MNFSGGQNKDRMISEQGVLEPLEVYENTGRVWGVYNPHGSGNFDYLWKWFGYYN